jgi:hypothetical protein
MRRRRVSGRVAQRFDGKPPKLGGEVAAKGECTLDVEVLSDYIAEGAGDIGVMVDLAEA